MANSNEKIVKCDRIYMKSWKCCIELYTDMECTHNFKIK